MAARALGPAEGSKVVAAPSQQDPASQQGKGSDIGASNAASSSENNGMRRRVAELQPKKATQQAGPAANAANTAARSVAGPKPDAQSASAAASSAQPPAAVPRPAPAGDGKAAGTAVPSVDVKDTPRHHEVTCMQQPFALPSLRSTKSSFLRGGLHCNVATPLDPDSYHLCLQDAKPVKPAWKIVVRCRSPTLVDLCSYFA